MVKYDRLALLLSWPAIVLSLCVVLTPLFFSLGSRYEGVISPVVIPLLDEEGNELPVIVRQLSSGPNAPRPYVDFYVQFDKVRDCDFLTEEVLIDGEFVTLNRSLNWYDADRNRLVLSLEPDSRLLPPSRDRGTQVAGPWRLYGVTDLVDTFAVVSHRCHPLWLTKTVFYPLSDLERINRNVQAF